MATNKPRITITLEKHQRDVIGRLAKANGQPMSRIVSELLDATTPYLERAVVLVEQAAKLRGAGLADELKQTLERADRKAQRAVASAFGEIDLFLTDTSEAVGGGASVHAQRAPETPPNPRASNHGGQVIKPVRQAPKRPPSKAARSRAASLRKGPKS